MTPRTSPTSGGSKPFRRPFFTPPLRNALGAAALTFAGTLLVLVLAGGMAGPAALAEWGPRGGGFRLVEGLPTLGSFVLGAALAGLLHLALGYVAVRGLTDGANLELRAIAPLRPRTLHREALRRAFPYWSIAWVLGPVGFAVALGAMAADAGVPRPWLLSVNALLVVALQFTLPLARRFSPSRADALLVPFRHLLLLSRHPLGCLALFGTLVAFAVARSRAWNPVAGWIEHVIAEEGGAGLFAVFVVSPFAGLIPLHALRGGEPWAWMATLFLLAGNLESLRRAFPRLLRDRFDEPDSFEQWREHAEEIDDFRDELLAKARSGVLASGSTPGAGGIRSGHGADAREDAHEDDDDPVRDLGSRPTFRAEVLRQDIPEARALLESLVRSGIERLPEPIPYVNGLEPEAQLARHVDRDPPKLPGGLVGPWPFFCALILGTALLGAESIAGRRAGVALLGAIYLRFLALVVRDRWRAYRLERLTPADAIPGASDGAHVPLARRVLFRALDLVWTLVTLIVTPGFLVGPFVALYAFAPPPLAAGILVVAAFLGVLAHLAHWIESGDGWMRSSIPLPIRLRRFDELVYARNVRIVGAFGDAILACALASLTGSALHLPAWFVVLRLFRHIWIRQAGSPAGGRGPEPTAIWLRDVALSGATVLLAVGAMFLGGGFAAFQRSDAIPTRGPLWIPGMVVSMALATGAIELYARARRDRGEMRFLAQMLNRPESTDAAIHDPPRGPTPMPEFAEDVVPHNHP